MRPEIDQVDVVGQAIAGDDVFVRVEHGEARTGIAVARLADAAHIEEVFVPDLHLDREFVGAVEVDVGGFIIGIGGPLRQIVDAPLVEAGDRLFSPGPPPAIGFFTKATGTWECPQKQIWVNW